MKKFFAVVCMICMVLALTAVSFAADKPMKGWITDEKCSAKVAKGSDANEACSKKCIEGGEKAVFVNDSDHSVVTIDNPDAIAGHEGHHVAVTGSVSNNSLHVDKVKMLGEKKGEGEHKM